MPGRKSSNEKKANIKECCNLYKIPAQMQIFDDIGRARKILQLDQITKQSHDSLF